MKKLFGALVLVGIMTTLIWWLLKDRAEADAPYASTLVESQDRARIQRVNGDFRAIHLAMTQYLSSEGAYPGEDLQSAISPYLKRVPMKDPWGKQVRYTPDGDEDYELRSAGPDGSFETSDDIVMDTGTLIQ